MMLKSPIAPTQRICCRSTLRILRRQMSSSSKNKDKWPIIHPKKQRLQYQQEVIRRDKLLPPPPSTLATMVKTKVSPDSVPEPTKEQLRIVALHQAIPFVGFGFMDNSILLLSGEAIDMYLGVKLGISTMCAAALGNIISDLAGVALGTVIEDAVVKWSKKLEQVTNGRIRLPPMPKLTYDQRNLRSVRFSTQMGCAVGLTIGCILGMFPLLFFPEVHHNCDNDANNGTSNGGNDDVVSSSSLQVFQSENERLKAEVTLLRGKFKTLAKEKQDAIWDKGY
eukprot:scaffold8219_cov117-Skeletonema_dohrnii-CCMP3373.AAC.2